MSHGKDQQQAFLQRHRKFNPQAKKPLADISNKELNKTVDEKEDTAKTKALNKQEEAYHKILASTKVPIHVKMRVDNNAEDAIQLFSTNVNGMSFWLKNNNKQICSNIHSNNMALIWWVYRRYVSTGVHSSHLKESHLSFRVARNQFNPWRHTTRERQKTLARDNATRPPRFSESNLFPLLRI